MYGRANFDLLCVGFSPLLLHKFTKFERESISCDMVWSTRSIKVVTITTSGDNPPTIGDLISGDMLTSSPMMHKFEIIFKFVHLPLDKNQNIPYNIIHIREHQFNFVQRLPWTITDWNY